MSNKKLSGVPDLSEMYDFYKLWNDELKDEILSELYVLLNYRSKVGNIADREFRIASGENFINKIESLGKKEEE